MTNNPYSLSGKKIIVTGAASGIGKATSIILSKLGANLILIDLNLNGLSDTKSLCNETDEIVEFDLKKSDAIKALVLDLSSKFGFCNGFVHLAGIPYISPLKSISENRYMDVLKINTIAGLEFAKVFANKKVSGDLPASIVFVSSVYALVGSVANVGYAMSKSALHGVTKSLAVELAPKKIRVNCIAPGFVRTKMMENNNHLFDEEYNQVLNDLHPLGLGEAEDVGYSIAFLLSDASKWITGSIMSVDGGFTAK